MGAVVLRAVLGKVFSKLHIPACLALLVGGNSSRQRGIRGPTLFTNNGQEPRQPPAESLSAGEDGGGEAVGWVVEERSEGGGSGPGGGGGWSEGG